MTDNKLISIEDILGLSKPATALIEKVSDAIGGLAKPSHIKRVARAETKAARIRAESEIEVTEINRRAMRRWEAEEEKRQLNIENVTRKAIPHLTENSDPSQMDNDWIVNFFDKVRIISDDEMQELWARVLAGEANSPGAYSKRSVNFLSSMDKKDADIFQNLCRFVVWIDGWHPLIFNPQASIYNNLGINYDALAHLDNIGLIRIKDITGYWGKISAPKVLEVVVYGQSLQLSLGRDPDNPFSDGHVLFTQIGRELVSFCKIEPVDGFVDYAKEMWKKYHPTEISSEN